MVTLARLRSPAKIQEFLDSEVAYNTEADGESFRSPRVVLQKRLAHCAEAALFAASALRRIGYPPLLMRLEAVRDDSHAVALFRIDGLWGAIAKSNYSGLQFREAIFPSLPSLVLSYFEDYFNLEKEKTLRAYSRPINLSRFDVLGWETAEDNLWTLAEYIGSVRHYPILGRAQIRRLSRVSDRVFTAGLVGRR